MRKKEKKKKWHLYVASPWAVLTAPEKAKAENLED